MEPVDVIFRVDDQGKIYPLEFFWKERRYKITSTGRRWEEEATLHILVMIADEQVCELVYSQIDSRWFLNEKGAIQKLI
jgi:hypothetical protein